MNMMSELAQSAANAEQPPSGPASGYSGRRRSSWERGSILVDQEVLINSESTVRDQDTEDGLDAVFGYQSENPELKTWAADFLKLPSSRLKGLEHSEQFLDKLEHRMLCWQVLRTTKLPVSPDSKAAFDDRCAEE